MNTDRMISQENKFKLYTLNKEQFKKLISDLKLDSIIVPKIVLGVVLDDNFKPFGDSIFVDYLFEDYIQRDKWLEEHIILHKAQIKYAIWSEASRVGNKQYIYFKESNFKFADKKPNYFKNVEEVIFKESIVVDFLSPFGVNHTNQSRKAINDLIEKNLETYNKYFSQYYNSILESLSNSNNSKQILINIIVSPNRTQKSILNFFKNELKIEEEIKCYDINERGAKTSNNLIKPGV